MSGNALRRPLINHTNYFQGYSTSSASLMRSTFTRVSRIRPSPAQSVPSQQNKTWHASRGIVFCHPSTIVCRGVASLKDSSPSSSRETTDHKSLPDPVKSESPLTPVASRAAEIEFPESPTSFKMTEELFKAAKAADPGTVDSFWSHQLYRGPLVDGKTKKPTIHYCKSKLTTERVLEAYFMDQDVIGFDVEWNPAALKHIGGARNNVSLVQLATEERILLCHLALYPKGESAELASPLLKKIMEDSKVTKVGVSIKADCTRLRNFLDINSQGLFELSHLYKLVKYSQSKDYKLINRSLVSLATQVQEHLRLPLFKGGDVRSSNWSQKLNLQQILYAAADSYAAVQLYHTMEFKRKLLNPTPPRPFHAELNLPIRIAKDIEIDVDSEAEEADMDNLKTNHLSTKISYARPAAKHSLNVETYVDIQDVQLPRPSFLPMDLSSRFYNSKLSANSTRNGANSTIFPPQTSDTS